MYMMSLTLVSALLLTLACSPTESADEREPSASNSLQQEEPTEAPSAQAQESELPEMIGRCIGTWNVSADSGKFDREGYFFDIQQVGDSIIILAFSGEIRDNRISYAVADLTPTSDGWKGVSKDEFYINETTWVFTSETTATMIVDGRFAQTNEFLGRKSIFLTKKE